MLSNTVSVAIDGGPLQAVSSDTNFIDRPIPLPPSALTDNAGARRARWVRVGWWCAAASLVWNLVEGVVAVWAGDIAHSVALVGFGINSFIEATSIGFADPHASPSVVGGA